MEIKTLLLWGDTQVGKTSLLAAALKGCQDRLPTVDFTNSPDVDAILGPRWNELCSNILTPSTSATDERYLSVRLSMRNGETWKIRDIYGGLTRRGYEHSDSLLEADAVLFVVEWKARNLDQQMTAVSDWSGTRLREHAIPIGLALTKCEQHLHQGDSEWDCPQEWWRSGHYPSTHEETLASFGEAIWPTSAYGYDEDSRPRCVLGEFGQVVPMLAVPKNVELPFLWLFERLASC